MGRHYRLTNRPNRIKRIREKAEQLRDLGVDLSRVDIYYGTKVGGTNKQRTPLSTMLGCIDRIGKRRLCDVERILEDILYSHRASVTEATAEVAYLTAQYQVPMEELLEMACRICPPVTDGLYEYRGVKAERDQPPADPFWVLRFPDCPVTRDYQWSFLQKLNLQQMELLWTQLKARGPTRVSKPAPPSEGVGSLLR